MFISKQDKTLIYHQRIFGIFFNQAYFASSSNDEQRMLFLTSMMTVCLRIIEKITLEVYLKFKTIRMVGKFQYPQNYIFFCFREEKCA